MIKFRLRALLKIRNMSQAEVSDITGIRPGTINAYYHGYAKRLNVKDLNTLCKKLDCKISDIIEYKPRK